MSSGYTTLRVVEAGVLLFDAHRARLGTDAEEAFVHFATRAAPGIYAVTAHGAAIDVVQRATSRLVDGIPVRAARSPLPPGHGPQPKPAPPSPYDALRVPGVATLLTDASGDEVLESCSAAVLAWDGSMLVAAPENRSRVASAAEAAVLGRVKHRRAPRLLSEGWPLLLLNAVAMTCTPQGSLFPAGVRAELDEIIAKTARRP